MIRRRAHFSACCLGAMLMLAGALVAPTPTTQRPGSPGGPICVTIIEPEVVSDLSAEDRKAIAGAVDTLLTEALAGRKDFVLVDRQALDKVLNEHVAQAAGVVKVDPAQVGEPLRPFWSAGVMICSQVDAKASIVIVEAVSAQTGQLLATLYAKEDVRTPEAVQKVVQPKLGAFVGEIAARLEQTRGKKLVEVSGRLGSKMERGQVLVDEAIEAVRARVALNSALVLLVPRQPLNTREERLLRVMGLSRPTSGDAAAGLCAAPDVPLQVVATEQTKPGLTFDDTPVELTLRLGDQAETFRATGGKFDECLKSAQDWLDIRLRGLTGGQADGDDTARAAELARQTMQAVAPWKETSGFDLTRLPVYLRSRILATASRAAHLDPTNEEAAWMVAALTTGGDATDTARQRRILHDCLKYVDRFPKASWDHRDCIMSTGSTCVLYLLKYSRGGWSRYEDLLKAPDPERYEFARPGFRLWATWAVEWRQRHGPRAGNAFEVCTRLMLMELIPSIPQEKLDEEYGWWKKFFKDKVSPEAPAHNGNDIAAPWELIDAAFAVRRKDPDAVRRLLWAAAAKVPKNETSVWGGDARNPYLVPVFLRAAGDPDWQKWDLNFTAATTVRVDYHQMSAFMSQLRPTTPDVWDYASMPQLSGVELAIPEEVRKAGFQAGSFLSKTVEAMAIAGGDLWVVTPAALTSVEREAARLFVLPLDAQDRTAGTATEITWPETDKLEGDPRLTCHYVTQEKGTPAMWLGTREHGLARFDKRDGRWVGRWYNSRHGLPSNGVSRITTCRNGTSTELLIIDHESHRKYTIGRTDYDGVRLMVWSLNSESGKATLIHDGDKDGEPIGFFPAAELADGRRIMLEIAGEGSYDPPPQVSDIRKVFMSLVHISGKYRTPITIAPDGARRIWKVELAPCIWELSARTLELVGGCPGTASSRQISPAVSEDVLFVLGTITGGPQSQFTASVATWPGKNVLFAVGCGGVLWMAFNTDRYWDHCRCVVGYRPAPPGSRDWAAEDGWIGPFYTPGKELIYGLQPDGDSRLLLSTQSRVLRLESKDLVEQARKANLVRSTVQWRQEYQDRSGRGDWQCVLPLMILNGQYDQAQRLLDKRAAEIGGAGAEGEESLRLLLWRARLLAEQKERLGEAIKLYDQAAAHPKAGPAGEAFARANQIVLLHRAGRWQEMLDLAQRVQQRFPQMLSTGVSHGMGRYVADAKRKLASSRVSPPESTPAGR